MPKPMFFDPSKVTKWSSSKTSTDASGAGGNMNGYAWYAGDMIKVPVPEQQGPQANINTGASTSSPVSSTQQAAADKQSVLASPGSYSYAHSIMDEDEYATPPAEANMGVDESDESPLQHPRAQVQGVAPPTLATYTTAQALKDCNDLYKKSVADSEAITRSYFAPSPASNSQTRGMQNPTISPVTFHDPGYAAPTLTQELSAQVQTLSAWIRDLSSENDELKRKVAELEGAQAKKSA